MKKSFLILSSFVLMSLFMFSCEKDPTSAIIQDVSLDQTGNAAATIKATILDDNGTLKSAKLFFKASTATVFKSVDFSGTVNGIFTAKIDSFPVSTEVSYYIEVVNNADLKSYYPTGAPATVDKFTSGVVSNSPLVVNEVFSNGTKAPDTSNPDWVEIYNSGNSTIDLTGYSVQDNIEKPNAKRTIKSGLQIAAKAYLVIYTEVNDDQAEANTGSFGLSTTSNDGVTLWNSNGQKVSDLYYPAPSAAQPTGTPNMSWGRFPNGGATSGWMIPSKGTENTAATPN
jgi:hypothetical protein